MAGPSTSSQCSVVSYFTRNESEDSLDLSELARQPSPKKARRTAAHHRLSGFNESWTKTHPWILFNTEDQCMFCTLCTTFNKVPRNGTDTVVVNKKLMFHSVSMHVSTV